jgi:hypothetical protein
VSSHNALHGAQPFVVTVSKTTQLNTRPRHRLAVHGGPSPIRCSGSGWSRTLRSAWHSILTIVRKCPMQGGLDPSPARILSAPVELVLLTTQLPSSLATSHPRARIWLLEESDLMLRAVKIAASLLWLLVAIKAVAQSGYQVVQLARPGQFPALSGGRIRCLAYPPFPATKIPRFAIQTPTRHVILIG